MKRMRADAVPFFMLLTAPYVPGATCTTAPGLTMSAACCNVFQGAVAVPRLESLPAGETYKSGPATMNADAFLGDESHWTGALLCQPSSKQITSTDLKVFVARGKSCMSFLTRLG